MSSKTQRVVIAGLESTPGDGATPDVAFRAICSLRAMTEKTVVEEDIGSFAPARHYIGSLHAEGELEFPDAYYEHAPYPISMALGAPSISGASDPWTHTFAIPDGAANAFRTYRLEYSDGNNHIVRADDIFATELEISIETGQAASIKATLAGGSTTFPAALGASLSPLASPTNILAAHTSIYMDDSFANIGVTQMTELISANWKLENLQHQKQFTGSLYPTGRGNDRWQITLEVIVEIDNAKIESEKDKLLNTSLTAIRLRSTASANDQMTIDGMYMLNEVDTLDDRDGNNTIKLTYLGQKDSSNNTGEIEVITNLSAL